MLTAHVNSGAKALRIYALYQMYILLLYYIMLDPEVMVPTPCPYALRAVIYYLDPFNKGHYTAHVKYRDSKKWILCNDNAVFA